MIYDIKEAAQGAVDLIYKPVEEGKKYTYLNIKVASEAIENDGTMIPTFMDTINIFKRQVYSSYGADSVRIGVSPFFKEFVEEVLEEAKQVLKENNQTVETVKHPFNDKGGLSVFVKISEDLIEAYNNNFNDNETVTGLIRVSIWYGPEKEMLGADLRLTGLRPFTGKKAPRKIPPKKRVLKENNSTSSVVGSLQVSG